MFIRCFFLCLFLFFPTVSMAVDFAFVNVPLSSFAAAVIKKGFGREYMIAPDVLSKLITFNVSVPDDKAFKIVEQALLLHGISMRDDGEIIFLLPSPSVNQSLKPVIDLIDNNTAPVSSNISMLSGSIDYNVKIYRPLYRDVSYLSEVVTFSGGKVMLSSSSSLLIYGVVDDESDEKIKVLLEAVDVPENSVYLHVVFVEVTKSNADGFTLSGLISMLAGRFSVDFGSSQSTGVSLTVHSSSVDSILSVLDEYFNFRYLAEPSLAVVHNQESKLVVGTDVPLRGSVGRDSSGVTLQAVTYKTTGLQMSVKPLIYDGYVMFHGHFEVSSITANSSSEIDSPLILRRSLSTVFPLRDGEVVILGGLDDNRVSNNNSRFISFPVGSRDEVNTSRILVLAEVHR